MRSLKFSAITPVLLLLIILAGCKKPTPFFDEINTGSNDANRKAVVKFVGGENDINVFALDVVPTLEDFVLIQITRDPNSQADVNQPLTVKLAKKSSLITDYNTANGTTFIELPLAAYSFTDDITNLTFAAGELIKSIVVHLKKDQMDLSKQYALGFTIAEVGAGGVISASKNNVLYSIGLKNQYDGVYSLTWTNYHPSSNPGYTGGTTVIQMHTSGATSCKMYWPDAGAYCAPAVLGGNLTYFGLQEPNYTVAPTTNAVTVQNVAAGAVTFYSMATGFNSRYDPATKTFYVKWGYGSGGPYPPFTAATTREWTQTFTYTGPR
jgi:hypothetical protein